MCVVSISMEEESRERKGWVSIYFSIYKTKTNIHADINTNKKRHISTNKYSIKPVYIYIYI